MPPCGSQSTVMGVDAVTHRERAVLTVARVGRCKGESQEHRFSSGWFCCLFPSKIARGWENLDHRHLGIGVRVRVQVCLPCA